ncbi:MAG TPA: hypothetical protein VFJ04_01590 [Rhodanobacteraceae bacterium]|jgi:hypothetical protein|nr:hypothetical protein [Rhodanobacteraceae bacterium]
MNGISRRMSRAGSALALGAMLALAGCSGNVKPAPDSQVGRAQAAGKFDATVESYKDDQFLLNGAVLSAVDLGAHFAFLKDQGKLPKTILLERSADAKIHDTHLAYMARMAIDYGFTVFYDHKGELRQIQAVEKNARPLEQSQDRAPLPDRTKDSSAAGNGEFSPQNGY